MARSLLVLAITLALGACGGSPPAPRPEPAPAPAPATTEPEPVAAPAALPELPYELARGSALPDRGAPARALLDRWSAVFSVDLDAHAEDVAFRVERTEIAWSGTAPLLALSGSASDAPRARHGTLFVIERDGEPGPIVHVTLTAPFAVTDTPGAAPETTPWLVGIDACDDAIVREVYRAGLPGLPPDAQCDDLAPTIAASVLARADATTAALAARAFLTELVRVALPETSAAIAESDADVHGARSRGASFVPFTATRDAAGLRAEGTIVLRGTCAPFVAYDRFALRVNGSELALDHTAIAREPGEGHCR